VTSVERPHDNADTDRAPTTPADAAFDDLLVANRAFAADFGLAGFDGVARAGVAMLTCMDSRIDPLGMIGLRPGDAKILRNPGGRVTDAALVALVVSVHLLEVERILVVEHTRCTMASATEQNLRRRISQASGLEAGWMSFGTITNQRDGLVEDVSRIRSHPLIPATVAIGGFLYDVDTGLLQRVA
jgi:carbonic anhydrase